MVASVTPSGSIAVSFEYGPDGSRIAKTAPSGKRIYAEADFEVAPDGTHIKYPHQDIRIEGTTKTWLHRDHLKSVRLTTNASGGQFEQSVYTPYGERTVDGSQISASATKGFIGERHG